MSAMESFGLERPEERLEHQRLEALSRMEIVGQTEVDGFEASGVVTNEDIADHLRENIPPTHLENCPSIEYETGRSALVPDAAGTFDVTTREIRIWGSAFEGLAPEEQREGVVSTVTHEVGHNTHYNMKAEQPELAAKWEDMHESSLVRWSQDGTGFVSDYARTSADEDFAESYSAYLHDPARMQFYSLDKYDFMRNEVFAGTEYESRGLPDEWLSGEGRTASGGAGVEVGRQPEATEIVKPGYYTADDAYYWVSYDYASDPDDW